MPRQNEIINRTAYYLDSIKRGGDESTIIQSVASAFDDLLETFEPPQRFKVLNREPRVEVESRKRAIIHERDKDSCFYCRTPHEQLTVDHIIPRSAFMQYELEIADRSDNLVSACWPCNEEKSNFQRPIQKRLGVTAACWNCYHRHTPEETAEYDRYMTTPTPIPAFCGMCKMTGHVPDLSWIL